MDQAADDFWSTWKNYYRTYEAEAHSFTYAEQWAGTCSETDQQCYCIRFHLADMFVACWMN